MYCKYCRGVIGDAYPKGIPNYALTIEKYPKITKEKTNYDERCNPCGSTHTHTHTLCSLETKKLYKT